MSTTIVSVIDKIGSAIPEISAGIANFWMLEMLILFFKTIIHNNEKDAHFVRGSKCPLI